VTVVLVRGGNPRRLLTAPVWLETLAECAARGVPVLAPEPDPPLPVEPQATAIREDITAAELADVLRRLDCHLALSLSDPDPAALRDAEAFAAVSRAGKRHLAGVQTAFDKHRTRELCARLGIPIARGVWTDRPDDLASLGGASGLVVKETSRWAGEGVHAHETLASAREDVRSRARPVLVEELVTGEEISIEVVRVRDRCTLVGWALKGRSDSGRHPLERLRYAAGLPPPAMSEAARRLVEALGLEGIAEVELIAPGADEWVVTEVNARPSGVTPLIRAATGVASPVVALRAATGDEPPAQPAHPGLAACEFVLPGDYDGAMLSALPGLWHLHPSVDGYAPRCYLAREDAAALAEDVALAAGPLARDLEERVRAAELLAPSPIAGLQARQ
jgi:ATP-grasp in the biosynthetic pathway with Ter operon